MRARPVEMPGVTLAANLVRGEAVNSAASSVAVAVGCSSQRGASLGEVAGMTAVGFEVGAARRARSVGGLKIKEFKV